MKTYYIGGIILVGIIAAVALSSKPADGITVTPPDNTPQNNPPVTEPGNQAANPGTPYTTHNVVPGHANIPTNTTVNTNSNISGYDYNPNYLT
jgi:hypothetical protein